MAPDNLTLAAQLDVPPQSRSERPPQTAARKVPPARNRMPVRPDLISNQRGQRSGREDDPEHVTPSRIRHAAQSAGRYCATTCARRRNAYKGLFVVTRYS